MKILGLIAAGLLGAVTLAPASASAAPVAAGSATLMVAGVVVAPQAVVVRERTTVRRGPGYRGNRWATRRVCTNRWRGHRKIRTCRQVRYRR
ncbi:hypothetical protein ASG11_17200 [Sphingomonas sp. Leaf357]|uniref:hypothetical protein n=1 Tax=Sphingomonas sp. Leaf357 TaxID=1736350 RepID=UPI0006FA8EF2|nr:hypothetical protein [Sphingomonas sp. Leaf357]KQS01412.1 hypothetical protein ASG11_17200 [Sphingomonas sp. Leaf357]